MDIVVGVQTNHCIVTLVERVTGATMIGLLRTRQVVDVNRRVMAMIRENRHLFRAITLDNRPEFHGYKEIEAATGAKIYCANPYASWKRGTNENHQGSDSAVHPEENIDQEAHSRRWPPTSPRCSHVNASTTALCLNGFSWFGLGALARCCGLA